MKKINMDEYKGNKKYMFLYDALIKDEHMNKDDFLLSLGVSPSSFRRAKQMEKGVGLEINKKLSSYFNLKLIPSSEIEEIEKTLNKVYEELYFKVYDNYESHKEFLDVQIKKHNVLFPIFKLFKLFLILNENRQRQDIRNEYDTLYQELERYLNFYNNDFKEIYEIVKITFTKNINKESSFKSYQNGFIYFGLASRYNFDKDYYSSLYFSMKAREILYNESNVVKLFHLNVIDMNNYNHLGEYRKCYELATNQLLALKSIKSDGFLLSTTYLHLASSTLGLKKYDEVIELLENKGNYQTSELYLLQIAYFVVNKDKYHSFCSEITNMYGLDSDAIQNIKSIGTFLKKKDKKTLMLIEKSTIRPIIIKILKNNFYKE